MKAVYITEPGGPEKLEIRDVPDPSKPTGTDVLVRVRAAGLNRADLIQRRGLYPPPAGYSPNIPGLEFAAEVVETGNDVSQFKPGDRVFGITAGEAHAELLKIDYRLLAPVPAQLDLLEAAAIPEVFITAYDSVFTQALLAGDDTLLIHAVGSGVGLAALQLAKAKGHRVIGTSRSRDKLDRCREYGLDHGIVVGDPPQFSTDVIANSDGGANVVLDLVGGSYLDENLRSMALKGRIMLVGLTAGRKADFDLGLPLSKRLKLIGTVLRTRSLDEKAEATRVFATEVVPMFEDGSVRPNLDRVFDLHDVRSAHEYLESNESFGKVVLRFD